MKSILVVVTIGILGCENANVGNMSDMATAPADLAAAPDLASTGDAATGDLAMCTTPTYTEDVKACMHAATDYEPRVAMSANDSWPACISDDNVFHQIGMSISTVARVQAFESVAKRLWAGDKLPAAQDFVDARVDYAGDAQGLDSRVQRRQDIHYGELPMGVSCNMMGVPALYPDRCAGPAKILPVLNQAFLDGSKGMEPRENAARIEAGLLWFLYLSTMSESWSCANNAPDCDSMWGYYNGAQARADGIGLAPYVKPRGPETHDRAFDGLLAVRCWRNLDNEMGIAKDKALQKRAQDQLDRALIRGMALVVRDRFGKLTCATGDSRAAHFAFLKTMLPWLDRAARAVDPAKADVLKAQIAGAVDQVDVAAAQGAIDALFPCP